MLFVSSIPTNPAILADPRNLENLEPETPVVDLVRMRVGDCDDDEGPTDVVDGKDYHGTEFHFVVHGRSTTGFGAPGLKTWAVQAIVDPSSTVEAAFAAGCPRISSLVTLDWASRLRKRWHRGVFHQRSSTVLWERAERWAIPSLSSVLWDVATVD